MACGVKTNTRRYIRAVGPFTGYHLGSRKTPVLVFNLNVGGGFVSFSDEQPAKTSFDLTIELPEDGEIVVVAQTVHREPFGIGVRFVDLSDDDARRVGRAVERVKTLQASSTPVVKLPEASVVYIFERKSEVMQIEIRYNNSAHTFQILRRLADGSSTQESFSGETAFRSRLDEIRATLEQDAWQTTGPNLLTDGWRI